jgi:hypothetical protein
MSKRQLATERDPAEIASEVIADASRFQRWWTLRRHPHAIDEAIVMAAEKAGLLSRGGGILTLSQAGLALRDR